MRRTIQWTTCFGEPAPVVPLAQQVPRLELVPFSTEILTEVPEPEPEPEPEAAPEALAEEVVVVQAEPDPELLAAALAQAEQEGLARAEEQVDALKAQYLEALVRIDALIKEGQRPSAQEVVELALLVGREVVGRELKADRQPLVQAIEEAIRTVRSDGTVRIRIDPSDLEFLRQKRPDLLPGVEWVAQAGLGIGGYLVETPQRVVDATIAARFEAVRVSLLESLQRSGQEPSHE